MILALDTGLRTLGWAIIEPRVGRVHELGALLQEGDKRAGKSEDLARRAFLQAQLLTELGRRHGVDTVIGEALSFPRGSDGITAVSLCWGVVCGVAAGLGARTLEVGPKAWQRGVMPGAGKVVDYDELASLLTSYVQRTGMPRALAQLEQIPRAQRTHALDAVGVGVFGAVACSSTCVSEPFVDRGRAPRKPRRRRTKGGGPPENVTRSNGEPQQLTQKKTGSRSG